MNKLVALFSILFGLSNGCMEMRGIGNGTDDVYSADDLSTFPVGYVLAFFLVPLVSGRDPDALLLREAPIQFRFLAYESIVMYNVLSYYDDVALEFWARKDVSDNRRRCNIDGETDQSLFLLHKSVAFAYICSWFVPTLLPETLDEANANLVKFGLDPYICDNNGCDVNSDDDLATPWGLAYAVLQEYLQYAANDGWNEDGSLSRDYNKIAFQDWRNDELLYTPVNDPWELKYTNRWQPLLESDGMGFLYNQEHVTPHIGYTGKSFVFSDDEFCQRSNEFSSNADNQADYDYEVEMNLAIERSAGLTDLDKMIIEAFDHKDTLFSIIASFLLGPSIGYKLDSIELAGAIVMNHVTLYEAGIAVWKEKVDFDLVRPTSIIHDQMGDQTITGYGGVSADGESYGTQTFLAKDWEPYIRTMPHSEYPSASATVCHAWANAYIDYFEIDEWDSIFPSGNRVTFAAYSSNKEPLSTPASDVTVSFTSFSNVADICSESRLWGGMHFTKSIVAGKTLANGIGERASATVDSLLKGEKPQFSPQLYDSSITHRSCYPGHSGSTSSDE